MTKVCILKAIVFPVVMYGCESWTIKKAECWRIDAFKLWCWRRLLGVPWTVRRSNQSNLKEINLKYLLEGLMLKLMLRYFDYLIQRVDSLEKTLMLGGQEEKGITEDEMFGWHHWFNGHELGQTPGDSEEQGSLACCIPRGCTESDTSWQRTTHCFLLPCYEQLQNVVALKQQRFYLLMNLCSGNFVWA